MSFIDDKEIAAAMSVKLDFDVLPEKATFQEGIRRAPDRGFRLTQAQTEIALKNALRSDLWLSLPSKRSDLRKTNR